MTNLFNTIFKSFVLKSSLIMKKNHKTVWIYILQKSLISILFFLSLKYPIKSILLILNLDNYYPIFFGIIAVLYTMTLCFINDTKLPNSIGLITIGIISLTLVYLFNELNINLLWAKSISIFLALFSSGSLVISFSDIIQNIRGIKGFTSFSIPSYNNNKLVIGMDANKGSSSSFYHKPSDTKIISSLSLSNSKPSAPYDDTVFPRSDPNNPRSSSVWYSTQDLPPSNKVSNIIDILDKKAVIKEGFHTNGNSNSIGGRIIADHLKNLMRNKIPLSSDTINEDMANWLKGYSLEYDRIMYLNVFKPEINGTNTFEPVNNSYAKPRYMFFDIKYTEDKLRRIP